MRVLNTILLIAFMAVLGLNAQVQPGNLIYNGNFEHWDTALYPLHDGGDTELCKNFLGNLQNEEPPVYSIKAVDCVRWLPYYDEARKYIVFYDAGNPIGYKNCYNNQHLMRDTNYPRKGNTFVIHRYHYDTVRNKYTRGKQFLYMPLTQPLQKGKTYQLDFDLKTGGLTDYVYYNRDTVDLYATKGYGFGFTEQLPSFIQNITTYETDLQPKVSLPYYNQKTWQLNTRYFTADSNYRYIVFGFFNSALNTHVKSKTPYCHLQYTDEIYGRVHVDNLFLQQVNDRLLPADTAICTGKSITIPSLQGKKLNWYINGILQDSQTLAYTFTPTANTMLVATDSLVSDTMYITVVPYPIFSISQTDTLCNEVTAFAAQPENTYTYLWLPEGLQGSRVKFQGNASRTVIARTAQGCNDTLSFTPILGTGVCGTYFIPNAFTPNKDEINEGFGIIGTGIDSVEMEIYTTWGEKIFNGKGQTVLWNGQYNNNPCPQGIYLYSIKLRYLSNGKLLKANLNGTVTLIR